MSLNDRDTFVQESFVAMNGAHEVTYGTYMTV